MVLKFIFLNEFSPVQSDHLGCPRFLSLIFTRVSDPIIVGVFHEFSQKISKVEIQTDIISRWSRARSKSIRGKDERVPERESECLNDQILNHILIINKICKISCRSSWFGFGFCKEAVRLGQKYLIIRVHIRLYGPLSTCSYLSVDIFMELK